MKADPNYREKILSLLQRDLGDYYGSGSNKGSTEDIEAHYLEKKEQAKKLQEEILKEEAAKQELQHSRLMKKWYGGSRMTQAVDAYEANR